MGTVKYTGPVASFHCPTNAEIRSLKVHFSPKQLGEGTPSPDNVREIEGWDGVEVKHTKNNLAQFEPYGTDGINLKWSVPKSILDTSFLIRYSIYIDNSNGTSEARIRCAFFNINGNRLQSRTRTSGVPVGQSKRDFFTIQPIPSGTDYITFGIKGDNFSIKEPMIDIFQSNAFKETPYEPYHGSTTNYEFGVLGKNKLDKNSYKYLNSSIICFGGDSSSEPDGSLFLKAGTYTFSISTTVNMIFATDANKKNIVSATNTNTATFTLPESMAVRIGCFIQGATDEEMLSYDYQLELGSSATTYEPYNPNKTVYGGWVDLISGEVQEEWRLLHFVKNYFIGVVDMSGVNYAVSATIWNAAATKLFRCDKLNSTVIHTSINNLLNPPYDGSISSDKRLVFALPEEITTLKQVQDLIDDIGGFDVAYKIETPNTYSLAPTQLQTFLGTNNVWSNADYVEVEYDLHETQDILARKQFIMASQPHVEEASGAIATFNTDMAAKLKECKVGFKPKQDLHGYSKPWVGGAGKNLFNINAIEQNPSDTTMANTTQRIFTPNTYAFGASYSNFWQANKVTDFSVNNNTITVASSSGYGVGFAMKVKPETYYTVSATKTGDDKPRINNAFYDSQGNYLGSSSSGPHITTFETPADTDTMVLIFTSQNDSTATFTDIQVEEGQTATAYEPYENICPIEGWNELELYLRGVNLQDEIWEVGLIDNTTGQQKTSKDSIITTNYLPVPMNTDLRIVIPENTSVKVAAYDKNKQFLDYLWRDYKSPNYTRKLNQCYLKLQMHSTYGLTYNNDIGLNYSNTETAYKPYQGTTIPIAFPATTNLFNEQWEQGNIEVGNNAGSSTCMRTDFIDVNSSTSYYLYTPRERNVFVFEYLEDGTYADKVNNVYTSHVFTTGSTTKKIRIVDRNSGTETVNTGINYPSTITYYEPYGTIYGGYVDLATGEVWKTHEMINLPVTAKQGTWDSTAGKGAYWYTSGIQKLATTNDGVLCNRCTPILNTTLENTTSVITWYYNGIIRWIDIGTMEMTVAEYRNYLAENPLQVTYKLNTPVLVGILSPSQLKSLRGINNVWSNTNDNITVKYWKH